MNSIPGREPRADTLGIHQPKETHKRGYYLALTFGTLLSSQGADAQKLQPSGLRSRRTSKSHHTASRPEDPPHDHHQAVSRGAERKLRAAAGAVKPVPRDPGHVPERDRHTPVTRPTAVDSGLADRLPAHSGDRPA